MASSRPSEPPLVRLLLVGDPRVGKSSVARLLTTGRDTSDQVASEGSPLVELHIGEVRVRGHSVRVEIVEPESSSSADVALPSLYSNVDGGSRLCQDRTGIATRTAGILLAYDASNITTLQSLQDYWLPALAFSLRRLSPDDDEPADLPDSLDGTPARASSSGERLRHRVTARAADSPRKGGTRAEKLEESIVTQVRNDAADMLQCSVLYVRCKGELASEPSRLETGPPVKGRVMDTSAAEGTADVLRFGEFLIGVLQHPRDWHEGVA
jgi:GTPase SAR1 family protein